MTTEPLPRDPAKPAAPRAPAAPKRAPRPEVRPLRTQRQRSLDIAEVGRPWFFAAPSIMVWCAKIAFLPFNMAVKIAELVLAGVILGIVGIAAAWYFHLLSDQEVMLALKPVGDRLLQMVQAAGVL